MLDNVTCARSFSNCSAYCDSSRRCSIPLMPCAKPLISSLPLKPCTRPDVEADSPMRFTCSFKCASRLSTSLSSNQLKAPSNNAANRDAQYKNFKLDWPCSNIFRSPAVLNKSLVSSSPITSSKANPPTWLLLSGITTFSPLLKLGDKAAISSSRMAATDTFAPRIFSICLSKASSSSRAIISVPRRGLFSSLFTISIADTTKMPCGVQNKPEVFVLDGLVSTPPFLIACNNSSGMRQGFKVVWSTPLW